MEGGSTKLTISNEKAKEDESLGPKQSYKALPETDFEDEPESRAKSAVKAKIGLRSPEKDGADEKMLPKDETKTNSNSNIAMSNVKISPVEKQNGDAKLDIGDLKSNLVGLTKEELMKYANDPFWIRLRWFLFITFWFLWAAMLVGAIMIIYAAPKCDPPPPRTWWQKGPLTELSDSQVGEPDILKAVKANGISGVIVEYTEDIYDKLRDDHPIMKLLNESKNLGVNVIVDIEPARSTILFEKFENNDPNYQDYFILAQNQHRNNWKMVDKNESAWLLSNKLSKYYYAPFGTAHLNFRNEKVQTEFSSALQTLLTKGAKGIRLKNLPYLIVDEKQMDQPLSSYKSTLNLTLVDYGFYVQNKTSHVDGLGNILYPFRKIVKNLTDNGPFMAREELKNIKAYMVNDTLLTVDLPLQGGVFRFLAPPQLNVTNVVQYLNNSYSDKVDWPLWKLNISNMVSDDAMDIVTYLLPGAILVGGNETIPENLEKLRESPSIMRGICKYYAVANKTVFSYIRVISGNPGYLVALNPTSERVVVNFPTEIPELSELKQVTVQLYSSKYNESGYMDLGSQKDALVPVSPESAIVLSYVPKKAN